ncbi:MAG: hypothetical protein GY854_05750 [Deltaproteobacteria bacterium]|nr:hypothetical protein [Deltaproteobacteria bacterium]
MMGTSRRMNRTLRCILFLFAVIVGSVLLTSASRAYEVDDDGIIFKVNMTDVYNDELPADDRIHYCSALEEASKIIFEMSNGSHFVHTAHFYLNSEPPDNDTDIRWYRGASAVPNANIGGGTINMYDLQRSCAKHWFTLSDGTLDADLYCRDDDNTCMLGACPEPGIPCHPVETKRSSRCLDDTGHVIDYTPPELGWVIAHEAGHAFYSLHDEYVPDNEPDFILRHYYVCMDDGTDDTSIMGGWGRHRFCDGNNHFPWREYKDLDGNILVNDIGTPYMAYTSTYFDGIWFHLLNYNNNSDNIHSEIPLVYDTATGYSALPPYPEGMFSCVWHYSNGEGPTNDALVIVDKSGSMGYRHPMMPTGPTALESAAGAAVSYYNQTLADHMVGITTFDTAVNNVVMYGPRGPNLTPLGVTHGGNTDLCLAIRDGADLIRAQYAAYGSTEPSGAQILLTDAMPTTSNCNTDEDVLEAVRYACDGSGGQIPVSTYTVAFGDADHDLMRKIAEQCNAQAMALRLDEVQNPGGPSFYMTTPLQVQAGLVRQGKYARNYLSIANLEASVSSSNNQIFWIPQGTQEIVVEWIGDGFEFKNGNGIDCRFENLGFDLVDPLGNVISTSAVPISEEPLYRTRTIKVEDPPAGQWVARVLPDPEFICLADTPPRHIWGTYDPKVATVISMRNPGYTPLLSLETNSTAQNDAVDIEASLEIQPNHRLTDIWIWARVSHGPFEELVWLYDDGAHNDGEPEDGVYGGTFNPGHLTLEAGAYRVEATYLVNAEQAAAVFHGDAFLEAVAGSAPRLSHAMMGKEATLILKDCVYGGRDRRREQCKPDQAVPLNFTREDLCRFSLKPATSYKGLLIETDGLVIGKGDVRVSLGLDIDVFNTDVEYDPKTNHAVIQFDAVVLEAAQAIPRNVIVTHGGQVVTSQDCRPTPKRNPRKNALRRHFRKRLRQWKRR